MNFTRYSDIELIQYYMERKELFPQNAEKAFKHVYQRIYQYVTELYPSQKMEIAIEDIVSDVIFILMEKIQGGRFSWGADSMVYANSTKYYVYYVKRVTQDSLQKLKMRRKNEQPITNILEDSLAYSNEAYYDLEKLHSVAKKILSVQEMKILQLGYRNELNSMEIAEELNISRHQVSIVRKKMLDKLRNYFKDHDIQIGE